MEYYIYMTNKCNLMCDYCSVLFDCEKNNLPITPEYDNNKLLEFINNTQEKYGDTTVDLIFFGGEPTLKYSAIGTLINMAKKALSKYQIRFTLHTNGLLLKKIPKEVVENLTLVILSVNYEKIPFYNMGRGYFETIIEGVQYVKGQSDTLIMARLTLSEKTSLYTASKLFVDICDYQYFQIQNCEEFTDFEKYYTNYAFEISTLFNIWMEKLKKGTMENIIPFMSAMRSLLKMDSRQTNKFCCGYGSTQIYVQTDGSCYACCDSVLQGIHSIGTIYEGIEFATSEYTEFVCSECKWQNMCMGRCGRMHKEFSEKHILEYCKLNEVMFNLFTEEKSNLIELTEQFPYYKKQLSHWLLDIVELTP